MKVSQEEKELFGITMRWGTYYLAWLVIIITVLGCLGAVGYVIRMRIEREAARNSLQRLESITGSLRDDMTSWYALDTKAAAFELALTVPENADKRTQIQQTINGLRAQQNALVRKMHTDADTLPIGAYDQLPRDIQQFLATHR